MSARFCLFGQTYLALGANPTSHFWLKFLLETWLSSASLEPLIDLLAYAGQELWLKNPISHKNQNIAGKV